MLIDLLWYFFNRLVEHFIFYLFFFYVLFLFFFKVKIYKINHWWALCTVVNCGPVQENFCTWNFLLLVLEIVAIIKE